MKALLAFAFCLLALPAVSAPSGTNTVTYYVQLVRGTDDDAPPPGDARQVGPKLTQVFEPIFRWKHYYEIVRREVPVARGGKVRVTLNSQRQVEIVLTPDGKRSVTAYTDGNESYHDTRPTGRSMTIIGGERDANSCWFIVVRRDHPLN